MGISAKRGRQQYTFKTAIEAWYVINQFLPNPDPVLSKSGSNMRVYRELLSDAHICACLESREAATLNHEWAIDRRGCPARIFKAIDNWFFNSMEIMRNVNELRKHELVDNVLDVIFWGYQPVELGWDLLQGFWLPAEIVPKPPEWFTYYIGDSGVPELRFLDVAHPVDGIPPPDNYTLLCPRIKPSYSNPYGRGVACRCFWPIVFKKSGIEFWLNFLERYGQPWVKGTSDTPLKGQDLADFKNDLMELVQDAVVVVTGQRDVQLLESQSASNNESFERLCEFMDRQMSKTILGHTLSTDVGSKGAYAAVRGAMTVRDDLAVGDLLMVKTFFNDMINMIMERNGYAGAERPVVYPYNDREVIDIERAQRDESLTRSGVRFTKKYYQRAYHLKDDDIKEIVDIGGKQVTGISSAGDDDGKEKKTGNNKE